MAAGDVTIIGPYGTTAAGVALADTALTALTHTDSASDTIEIITCSHGLGFFILNVEGA